MTIQTVGTVPEWSVSDRLRKAREHAGYEQAALAEAIGVSKNTIGNYERGAVTPRRPVLLSWALATGVPLVWLVDGESPRPQDEGSRDVRPKGLEPPTFWFGLRVLLTCTFGFRAEFAPTDQKVGVSSPLSRRDVELAA